MQLSPLTAVSPIDGRYHTKTEKLSGYFSEYALFRYRVKVEIEYFVALVEQGLPQLNGFDGNQFPLLRKIYEDFSIEDAIAIKETEKITNHDVKAVEYFIKDQMDRLGLGAHKEFVHFGLTSQDVNNTATPLMLKDAHLEVYLPGIQAIRDHLQGLAKDWEEVSMLARTHGQPASPTSLGKEIIVFVERLNKQLELLAQIPFSGKFGGATGNFNAHKVAYPQHDWRAFGQRFMQGIGLQRQEYTTQIEHYDNMAALFDGYKRINTILIDLCRDIWQYVSMEFFKQKINKNEVGSSAMPHKVNPIDFENAEGNLGIASALLEHLAAKLPISRLQRDLTDSTVTRNIGVPMAHILISFQSIEKGLGKLMLNKDAIDQELENNWMVVAEALQTILRREGYPKPYEKLKELTRTNEKITQTVIHNFIDTLDVSDNIKTEMKTITPHNYTGYREII